MKSKPDTLPKTVLGALFSAWTWRMAWRDSRNQRLRLLIFSMAIVSGIAALVAIQSLKVSVDNGVKVQAKELLGADVQVSSRRAISDEEVAKLSQLATRSSRELAFPTMMRFPDGSAKLVFLRALEGDYPFYGTIETAPTSAWAQMRAEPGVVLDAALFNQFGLRVGDEVGLGDLQLPVWGEISLAPPSTSRFGALAPAVYVRYSEIERSGLLGPKSMVSHLVHLEASRTLPTAELKSTIKREFDTAAWRVETPEDRRETVGDALDLFQRYLGILAFASLALGGLGVMGAVQSHLNRRITTIAILRCLGAPRHLAAAVYIAQTAALGLLGSVVGALIGIGIQIGVLEAFRENLPVSVTPSIEWAVVARTALAGFGVCCAFALVPLLKIRHVSPAVTLRRGAELPGGFLRSVPVYLALAVLLTVLAYVTDPDWKRSAILVGGLALAFLIVAGISRGLLAGTRFIVRPRWPYLLRQGVSNLYRPGNQTLLFLLSLGLGTFLLLTILLVGDLLQQRIRLPDTAQSPNLFLIDVQADQVEGVASLVQGKNLPVLESAPMIPMRIQAIRGVPVDEVPNMPRWIASREFRSTYRDELGPSETVVGGVWHGTRRSTEGLVPVSLEEGLAEDIQVEVGDTLTLDVQGVPIEAEITSLRKVDWSRFTLNFFMIFPSGTLEGAPGFHVVTTRTPNAAASGDLQRALAAEFANVTSIDLTQLFERVRSIFTQISRVIALLGSLTLLAAIPIVIGTLLNGRDVRRRESVLLRTLGASSWQVRSILMIEFAALGILSALTGVLLAIGASAALAVFVFKTPAALDPGLVAIAFTTTTAIAILGGWLLSRGVTERSPLESLRHQ